MELNLIEEINKRGLETFISKYSLNHKDYGHKFSLKYNQIKTTINRFTTECRGIVLSKDLEVMSLPFVRFSNYEQNSRKTIDWDTARYYEKSDGSMIQLYFDNISDKWCVGTTGTAESVDLVSCSNKITKEIIRSDFTLTDLFFRVCSENNVDYTLFDKGVTYIFELVTEFNLVVNYYKDRRAVLLGARDLTSLDEWSQDKCSEFAESFNIERPKEYFFDSEEEMINSLSNVKHGDTNFEGYVVVDSNFNRVKVKSNMYIIFSQFNGDISSKWRLVDVVFNNEIDEVVSAFPEMREQLDIMKSNFDSIIAPVKETFHRLKEKHDILETKDFYIEGSKSIGFDKNKKPLLGIFTSLSKNKDVTWEEALSSVRSKKLYETLKQIK